MTWPLEVLHLQRDLAVFACLWPDGLGTHAQFPGAMEMEVRTCKEIIRNYHLTFPHFSGRLTSNVPLLIKDQDRQDQGSVLLDITQEVVNGGSIISDYVLAHLLLWPGASDHQDVITDQLYPKETNL